MRSCTSATNLFGSVITIVDDRRLVARLLILPARPQACERDPLPVAAREMVRLLAAWRIVPFDRSRGLDSACS
jgi:hypothetical protein